MISNETYSSNKLFSCYVCGTMIKADKHGVYKCPKCKAYWTKDEHGNTIRIYDNYKDYIED